ncbi:hypothetical protein HDF09_000342 [Edaphobacter lichenicola]|uniref:Uncharacterized protein n=1 Tax=Tunturiibacter empetritectus TaxID=3069691 RepID=A0A7W8IEI9_9BACT|nr:hypothetical protein [Edaphobacter lichenicola]
MACGWTIEETKEEGNGKCYDDGNRDRRFPSGDDNKRTGNDRTSLRECLYFSVEDSYGRRDQISLERDAR